MFPLFCVVRILRTKPQKQTTKAKENDFKGKSTLVKSVFLSTSNNNNVRNALM